MRITQIPEGFNWLTVLEGLSADGEISDERYEELDHMAGKWPTCACGQLCRLLPRNEEGMPLDGKLRQLGGAFSSYVNAKQWCVALATFHKIEDRTTELLELQGVLSPSSGRR